ncbi:unnamed protein product [Diamesa hyperborea]
MKCVLVLTVLLFADVLLASPIANLVPRDAADIPEPNHRWALVPTADGHMHLVDLNPIEVETIEPMFNAVSDVFFILYTRSNRNGVRIRMNANEIRASTYNRAHPTRFLIHGWDNDQTATVNVQGIEAYLRRGNFNVIVVDWGVGAITINYISARNRVNSVGPFVASFIDFMDLNGFINFNILNLVGHSLGGHAVGIAAKRLTRGVAEAVFSLDPAGPLFSINSPDTRVASTDANYVEVIHTNGGVLGFLEPLGQADFFPNWGSSQPGCGDDVAGFCSHARVVNLFAESINTIYTGQRCQSFTQIQNRQCTGSGTARMGGDNGRTKNAGIFFMETNAVSPFSRG